MINKRISARNKPFPFHMLVLYPLSIAIIILTSIMRIEDGAAPALFVWLAIVSVMYVIPTTMDIINKITKVKYES